MTIRIRELTINATIVGNDSNDDNLASRKQGQLKPDNDRPFVEDELKARRER